MGRIGYGYGSEWQLLRMLGRHRKYFDDLIKKEMITKCINITFQSHIVWEDFNFEYSKDAELSGSVIFESEKKTGPHPEILKATKWDCVGRVDNILLLVEAKGRLSEFINKNGTNAKDDSKNEYRDLIKRIHHHYGICPSYEENWLKKAFQIGNRIAMHYYVENFLGIRNYLVYAFFLNDWRYGYINDTYYDTKGSVKDKEKWLIEFDKKLDHLGFETKESKDSFKEDIILVFPDCNQKSQKHS